MSTMHPVLALYLRITVIVALAILGLVLAAVVLKILLVAAVIAAVIFGGFFLVSMFRRRAQLPTIR